MANQLLPVKLDGVWYPMDVRRLEKAPVAVIREQSDQSREFGEASLNPYDLWRRSQSDWRFGTGQLWMDKDAEDVEERNRFAESLGIDPWERGKLKLLKDVSQVKTFTADDFGKMIVAGDRLYVALDEEIAYTTDGSNWTTINMGGKVNDLASNGFFVWVATEDGLYYVTTQSDSVQLRTNIANPNCVAWVKGRLMVTAGSDIYNITDSSSTAVPDPLTPATLDTGFTWDCFGETGAFILTAGHAGDKALVYRITIREDGTALGAPTVAAPLPDGEQVLCLKDYVGVTVIGTTLGVRVAVSGSSVLQYGPLIEVGPVHCLEPQERFMWFGWSNPTDSTSGLGRLNLAAFTDDLQPAYATDLQADTQGEVISCVTFQGKRWFSIAGNDNGIWKEADTYRTSGTVRSGKITFGLPDSKAHQRLLVRCEELDSGESVDWKVLVDGVSAKSGSITGGTGTDPEVDIGGTVGYVSEVELELKGPGTSTPEVTRWTLRALPIPSSPAKQFRLPIELRPRVRDNTGREYFFDVLETLQALEDLEQGDSLVEMVLFGRTYEVYVDAVAYGPEMQLTEDGQFIQGPLVLVLRTF